MGRGYQSSEIRQKLIDVLEDSKTGMSGVEISEKVWEVSFDTGTNIIDVYINFLRKKVDRNFGVKLIYTMVGMGYIMKEPD